LAKATLGFLLKNWRLLEIAQTGGENRHGFEFFFELFFWGVGFWGGGCGFDLLGVNAG